MKQSPRSLVWCLVIIVSALAESWSVQVSVQRENGCDVANISPAHGTWTITCQPLELCTPGGCHLLDDGDTWSLDTGTTCYPPM